MCAAARVEKDVDAVVVVAVRLLDGVADRRAHAEVGGALALADHVGAAHQLAGKAHAEAAAALDVGGEVRLGALEVRLVGVEDERAVAVVGELHAARQVVDRRLHVGLLGVDHEADALGGGGGADLVEALDGAVDQLGLVVLQERQEAGEDSRARRGA
jgi:hypothetical protein